jgi:3-deoxy-D-manno-octulosonic-acid transferase
VGIDSLGLDYPRLLPMLIIYRLITYLIFPLIVLRFIWRGCKNPDYFNRIKERFGYIPSRPNGKRIWLHAVSVGEVNASLPLVSAMQREYPQHEIIITTMTTTGAQRVESIWQGAITHYYLPYDFSSGVRRFLARLDPSLAIIMETEIWPVLITQAHQYGVKLIYANMRLSASSYRKYARARHLFAPILDSVSYFAVQSLDEASRIIALGAREKDVEVTGSLKFDFDVDPSLADNAGRWRKTLGANRLIWLAASTHEGEETMFLEAQRALSQSDERILLVLVPRHPERFNQVDRLSRQRQLTTKRRSRHTADRLDSSTQVFLLDSMGELQTLIAAADVCVMGGSFVATGGHNILEAMAVGTPVIFGPHMFNFKQIAAMSVASRAGIQLQSSDELIPRLIALFADKRQCDEISMTGLAFVKQHRGALAKMMLKIRGYLSQTTND